MPLDTLSQPRTGNWTQTFTGGQFWPLDPRPEDFDIEDIAHGLAHVCRFSGQCRKFYSVAQHSVILSENVLPEYSMEALLHDATEAYIGDIPGPLKAFLPEYSAVEARIWTALAQRFDLPPEPSMAVKVADSRILGDEARALFSKPPANWNLPFMPFGIPIRPWDAATAERKFLERFDYLSKGKIE